MTTICKKLSVSLALVLAPLGCGEAPEDGPDEEVGVTAQAVSSPIALWEAELNTDDTSGAGNHATTSSILYAVPGNGGSQGAFQFGGNQYVQFTTSAGNFGTSDFHLSFYVRTSSTSKMAVANKRASCKRGNFISARMMNGHVYIELDDGVRYVSFNSSSSVTPINDGQWHFVEVARAGASHALYIDGSLVASKASGGVVNINNATTFQIGQDPCVGVDGTHRFVGDLDDVALTY